MYDEKDIKQIHERNLKRENSCVNQQTPEFEEDIIQSDQKLVQMLKFNTDEPQIQLNEVKKVLMMYVGGHLGMVKTEQGLQAQKGYFEKLLRDNNYLCDLNQTLKENEGFLITPLTNEGNRIKYKVYEFDQVQNSATFSIQKWVEIASKVQECYDQYDGFLIITGTSTITYMASALSFMFENLNKPVVLTCSNIPFSQMVTDAFTNVLNSLIIAGQYQIPEIFRGNRSSSFDTNGFAIVNSPNFMPLGKMGTNVKIYWKNVLKDDYYKPFYVFKDICPDIINIKINPLLLEHLDLDLIQNPKIKGIILESYNTGYITTIYDDKQLNLYSILKQESLKGKVIINISQSYIYNLRTDDRIGMFNESNGIINGGDMTFEAAMAKLSYLLGKYKQNTVLIKQLIKKNLRGELTPTSSDDVFSNKEDSFIQGKIYILILAMQDTISQKQNASTQLLQQVILPNIVGHMSKLGYVNFLNEMKNLNVDFNKSNYSGTTCMHVAAREGHLEVIKFLIKLNNSKQICIPINQMDKNGRTPMFEAVLKEHKEIIYELKINGGIIKGANDEITTILLRIGFEGNIEKLKLFYYSGIKDLEKYKNIEDRNIGHIAVSENQIQIVQFLIKLAHFDFSHKDNKGRTALDEAIHFDHQEIIQMLS